MCSYIYNFIKKHLIALLLLLIITACESNQYVTPRCIPADVFSEVKTASVSSYFDQNSESFIADDQTKGNVNINDQVVRWKYTGYVTDGHPIVLSVEGMWTAWVQNNDFDAVKMGFSYEDMEYYNRILPTERICGPYNLISKIYTINGQRCEIYCKSISGVKDDLEKGAYGPPCWFNSGHGAYLLFKRPSDPEPNETLNLMRYPLSPVMYIGYEASELAGYGNMSTRGHDNFIKDYLCNNVKLEPGWKIYIKILDNNYYDNVGGYAVTFFEGVKTETQFSVFEWVRKKVRGELDSAGKKIFKHVVENPVFKNFIFGILTLFLICGSLAYIFGIVRSPFADIIVRVLKISLMILLISPSSWDFFYNHLLNLFIHGTDQIIAMINSHVGQYDPENPFAFMDEMIINKIFSPIIWKIKIRALIVANFSSIFAVIVIIIAVLLYIALCMYGFVIYLTAFVGITLLVGLLPLLLIGILFSRFKSLFDGWLTHCISFSMQSILVFTMISLFGALIMNYYYRIFGFTACYNEWMKIKVCILGNTGCIVNKSIFGWTPGQIYDPKIIGLTTDFDLNDKKSNNARYKFTGGARYIRVPPDYKDWDMRYVDYPFLDPDSQSTKNPFGVRISIFSKFYHLFRYVDALLNSDKDYVAARLVKKIEDELNNLLESDSVMQQDVQKVMQIINKRREKDKNDKKNELNKYQDKAFKADIVNSIVTDVLKHALHQMTPREELIKQYDYNLILRIQAGDLILWTEVGSLFLAALLIWQMRAFIQSVAVSLSGGSMMSQTIAGMYEGGFMRIFSGIPVIGKAFEFVDGSVDTLKLLTGNYITKVARRPLTALQNVPYLGGAIKFTSSATDVLTSSYNEYDRSFDDNFRKLNYARAFIGAHLGFSPLNAMKYLGGHAVGKMLGDRDGGLIHNIIEDREAALNSLKAHMLGPEKYKPSPYIPYQKEEDDDRNPFISEETKDRSSVLLDRDGNVHINKENLEIALEAREQLKTMLGKTKDENALQNINNDIDRLDGALHKYLDDDFDNVTRSYADSRKPVEHPIELLDEDLSKLNISLDTQHRQDALKSDTATQCDLEDDSKNLLDEDLSKLNISLDTQHRQDALKSDTATQCDLEDDSKNLLDEALPKLNIASSPTKRKDILKSDTATQTDDNIESHASLDVVSSASNVKPEILQQRRLEGNNTAVDNDTILERTDVADSVKTLMDDKAENDEESVIHSDADLERTDVADSVKTLMDDKAENDEESVIHSDAESNAPLDIAAYMSDVKSDVLQQHLEDNAKVAVTTLPEEESVATTETLNDNILSRRDIAFDSEEINEKSSTDDISQMSDAEKYESDEDDIIKQEETQKGNDTAGFDDQENEKFESDDKESDDESIENKVFEAKSSSDDEDMKSEELGEVISDTKSRLEQDLKMPAIDLSEIQREQSITIDKNNEKDSFTDGKNNINIEESNLKGIKGKSSKSKSSNTSKAKVSQSDITPKSLKNIFQLMLNQCEKDKAQKFFELSNNIFNNPKTGKQKSKLSKQDISLLISQFKEIISSLKAKKATLSDINEIKTIEESIKQAETSIKNLLMSQE